MWNMVQEKKLEFLKIYSDISVNLEEKCIHLESYPSFKSKSKVAKVN